MRTHHLLATSLVALALATAPGQAQQQSTLNDFVAADDPPLFDAAQGAVDAFKAALAANDLDALAKLLGLDPAKL